MKKELEGWWFSTANKKLGYGDNRPVAVGLTHTVTGPPVLCGHGLHLSVLPLDAMRYAPGSVIWRVKISGGILIGDDKAVGTTRTYLAGGVDISAELQAFARAEALAVAHLWDAPEIVLRYLRTGDKSLREKARAMAEEAAERAAAWAAAWAAEAAAEAAAGAAAGEAAREAARVAKAARAAAWTAGEAAWAAGAAAREAAGAAAREARASELARQNLTLEEFLTKR